MNRKRLILTGLSLLLLAALALGAPAWARPFQRPNFQTVPTPTPPTQPSPTIPPQPTQPPPPPTPSPQPTQSPLPPTSSPQPTQPSPPTQPPPPTATPLGVTTAAPATAVPSPPASPTETPAAPATATRAPEGTAVPTPTVPAHPSAGPKGGGISFRWQDGSKASVSVPPGCLDETLWLAVQPLPMPGSPVRMGGDWFYPSRLGMVLDAWHASTGKPFPRSDVLPCLWKVRLAPSKGAISPVEGNLERLRIAWYDESAGRWVPLETSASGGSVAASTEHTGAFGLMLVPPAGPPESLPDTGADRGWIATLAAVLAASLALMAGALVSRRRSR